MMKRIWSVPATLLRRIAVLAALLSVMPAALANIIPTLEVSTTQQGANTAIDRDSSKIWNFLVGDGIVVEDIVGSFVLKEGQGTRAPIMFSLFGGIDAVGDALATDSVAAGDVGQSFDADNPLQFHLNDINIGPGSYSLKLYSPAVNIGRYQWFFKGKGEWLTGNFGVLAAAMTGADGSPVPEPGTLALLGIGLAGAGFVRRRTARQRTWAN